MLSGVSFQAKMPKLLKPKSEPKFEGKTEQPVQMQGPPADVLVKSSDKAK